MIDKLVLRCDFKKVIAYDANGLPFTRWPDFRLAEFGVPLEQSIDREGEVFNTRHPWESIPSSYESMAFKIFDSRYDNLDKFYIEINASPAKIMQGHNVFGSDDIYACSMALLELLCNTYPQLVDALDHESWYMASIDITYSSRAESDTQAKAFINALQNVSYGQTKSRNGYDGTAYFGKKQSRLKKIKVYYKESEVKETIKKNVRKIDGELLNEVYTPELIQFSVGLIRWEVSLYHRYFERLGISCYLKDIFKKNTFASIHIQNYWRLATSDLFKSLEGEHMKLITDEKIHKKLRDKFKKVSDKTGKVSTANADCAFRTFRFIKQDGWYNTLNTMSSTTFYRHVSMLTACGLSRAALQNLNGLDSGAVVIPFVRYIEVKFDQQFPDWYQPNTKVA